MSRQQQTTSWCTQENVAVTQEVKALTVERVMCDLSASASKRSHLYTYAVLSIIVAMTCKTLA